MGHRSTTYSSKKTGKPVMAYSTKAEAEKHAHYAQSSYQIDLDAYHCKRCNLWHLAPKKLHISFNECRHCQGRDGKYKVTYPSEDIANERTEIVGGKAHVHLRLYACPHCDGWHLTSSR